MVNPLVIIAMFLGAVFLIALLDKIGRSLSMTLMFMVLTASCIMSVWQITQLFGNSGAATDYITAGFRARFPSC
jgi:hypothetical protein